MDKPTDKEVIDRLARACIMAYQELEFGGDWRTARRVVEEAVRFAGYSLTPAQERDNDQ